MNKILQLADKKIHIQWINYNYLNESKPVLIFLHEALGSIIQWKSFPAELCEQTKSCGIIIERSGHGQSSPLLKKRNQNYLHEYAEETIEVLNLILSQNPLGTVIDLFFHFVIYLPSSQLAYVSNYIILLHLLGFFNT